MTIENQPDIHGRIRLAVRQNRFLYEQASSSIDGVKPVWDEVDWSSKTTPSPILGKEVIGVSRWVSNTDHAYA